ncbi:MAG: hypothetical protein HC888_05170 [Candidatus Competibacteraceae bacterium]|nr:hypothetical protein [Candidatus Competibacteraceae bacterium]
MKHFHLVENHGSEAIPFGPSPLAGPAFKLRPGGLLYLIDPGHNSHKEPDRRQAQSTKTGHEEAQR